MKNLFLLLVILNLLGCSDDDKHDVTPQQAMYVDSQVYLAFKNAQGQDLLAPSTVNHFKEEDIRLYYVRDGVKREVYDPLMDMPRNLRIEDYKDGYILRVATDEPPYNVLKAAGEAVTGEALTLLKLNESTTDTIRTAWERRPGSFINTKLWYNGELRWDRSSESIKPLIVIMKE